MEGWEGGSAEEREKGIQGGVGREWEAITVKVAMDEDQDESQSG